MPCDFPLTAFYSKEIGKSGKRGITFDRGASFSGVPLQLPCGQCTGCRLARSLQWAIRCMHEKSLHTMSSFVTLTYDDNHLPEDGSLSKDDPRQFMYRLREHLYRTAGLYGLRFYMCGEYGARTNRPHYHYLFFNLDFLDKKFYKLAKGGERLYKSPLLDRLWPFGSNIIGAVTMESCAYVARYITDKITGDRADDWYQGRIPEFVNMSRRPGIGAGWYEKFGSHSHKSGDFAVLDGKKVAMPRFYDKRFELVDGSGLAVLKKDRRRKALLHKADSTVDRRKVRRIVRDSRMSQMKREFD